MTTMSKGAYPENWTSLAYCVKREAGFRCEKCGSPSVPRHVLTVHHLDGDKSNCSRENLVALCQVCHLHVQATYTPEQAVMWPEAWQARRGLG